MTNTPQGVPAPDGDQPVVNGQPVPGQPTAGGQPAAKYGTGAYDPTKSYEPTRPSKVDTLIKLTLASLGLWVLSQILGLVLPRTGAFQDDMREFFVSRGLSTEVANQAVAQNASGLSAVGPIIMLLIGAAVYFLVYSGLTKDKGWARVVGIVLTILSLVLGLGGLLLGLLGGLPLVAGGFLGVLSLLVSLALMAVNVAWLVTAFNGQVSAWFRERSIAR